MNDPLCEHVIDTELFFLAFSFGEIGFSQI